MKRLLNVLDVDIVRHNMTAGEHGELCVYLNDWMAIWNKLSKERKTKEGWKQAKLISDTLSELLIIDAEEAGL